VGSCARDLTCCDDDDSDDCASVEDEFDDVKMLFERNELAIPVPDSPVPLVDTLELLVVADDGRKSRRPFTFSNIDRYSRRGGSVDSVKLMFLSICTI